MCQNNSGGKSKRDVVLKSYRAQIEKINRDKWCEGCRTQRDPGKEFVISWIEQNAAWFREAWSLSLCCTCEKWCECGYKVETECGEYQPEEGAKES
jgi:hypothetical protein